MARITKLRISGYRSIGDPIEIHFPQNAPVILVGENNAGKSNIVRALNLVLGPFWPGNHDPEDHEFFGRTREHPIEIEVTFDSIDPLGGRLTRVLWRYDPSNENEPVYFRGVDTDGKDGRYISSEIRDDCVCIMVEADRNLAHHLSYSSKWTLLSRLMHRFHRALRSHEEVRDGLEKLFGEVKNKFYEIPEFADFVEDLGRQLEDLVGSMTHKLEVDFQAYNPVNFFHALRLHAKEGDEPRTLEEMGTGEQQVLALALAHAYAKAFHGGIVLVIEEPEAHLHPLAQQWLARKLKQQCQEGLQLVITTHSPAFLDIENLEGLILVSKKNGQTKVKQLTRQDLVDHCIKSGAPLNRVTVDNILPFYQTNSTTDILAGFFAKCVVLVEGQTESLALPIYFSKVGLDVEREGVAVIPVQGKGNLAKWRRLFEAYGIPCYTVFDNDSKDDSSGSKRRDALQSVGIHDDEEIDQIIHAQDWIVNSKFTVFGVDFETALRSSFRQYHELEEQAGEEGIDSKPFKARWVAERLDFEPPENQTAKEKIEQMVQMIRRKLSGGELLESVSIKEEDEEVPF